MIENGFNEKKLELLRDITGAFRPGVLTALMGVSGAGKTTLMDVLSGRKTGGTIEGDIRISGYPKVQKTFARISGYCEQTDIHSPHVTVEESVMYSAWLRLPPETDPQTKSVRNSFHTDKTISSSRLSADKTTRTLNKFLLNFFRPTNFIDFFE